MVTFDGHLGPPFHLVQRQIQFKTISSSILSLSSQQAIAETHHTSYGDRDMFEAGLRSLCLETLKHKNTPRVKLVLKDNK